MTATNLSCSYSKLIVAAIFCMTLSVNASSDGETWSPKPSFTIDGSNYIETLTFISGITYGLYYSDYALKEQGKLNFICFNDISDIDSKALIEILNKEISGNITAEQATGIITFKLQEYYPCGKN